MEQGRQDRGIVVAIDGPSGSGKSTVSRRLARELGLAYLDTGAMYRAATWWSGRSGVDLDDVEAVAEAVRAMPLTMVTDPDEPRVVCDGVDITDAIREAELTAVVSKVATNLEVRAELKRLQREIIEHSAGRAPGTAREPGELRGIVAEGRDITTVVAPDADVRILLVADERERLARRAKERHGTADADTIEATRDEVVRRDADDSTVSTFLTAADGVVTVDSSSFGVEETFAAVLAVVTEAQEARR
ncbi:cytidylate kinase [Georgenia soli]|uniref:Cytidylate kinase n=1 Tax=Georgenia soli TaxID=638953 RepID=A0A2A9EHN7_9MICO|nr:(d)CMP kinase [Georgenia soli]PFG38126.1 cytidylate kinase [Georgenia soli]